MFRAAIALLLAFGTAAIAASAPIQPQQVPVDVQIQQARTEAAAAGAEQQRLEKAAAQARDDVTHHVGLIYSSDSFYNPRAVELGKPLVDHGVLAVEMEACTAEPTSPASILSMRRGVAP